MLQINEKLTNGTYGSVKFTKATNERLYDFGVKHNIPGILNPEDFHTTTIYSRRKVNVAALGKLWQPITVTPKTFKWEMFGEQKDILVLTYQSEFLHRRWQHAMNCGATYDFDTYRPHVTMSYDAEHFEERIDKLPLPTFNLYIGEEVIEDLKGD